MSDNVEQPPIHPRTFLIIMGVVAGGITGLLFALNLTGGDWFHGGVGLLAGACLGLAVPLAAFDIADETPARSRADKTGAWLVRLLLILALGVFLFDRVQLEMARQKINSEVKKPEQGKSLLRP